MSKITDADGDTYVESYDEIMTPDHIDFKVDGTDAFKITQIVDMVHNPMQAKARIDKAKPDLLFLDINMPYLTNN